MTGLIGLSVVVLAVVSLGSLAVCVLLGWKLAQQKSGEATAGALDAAANNALVLYERGYAAGVSRGAPATSELYRMDMPDEARVPTEPEPSGYIEDEDLPPADRPVRVMTA